MKMSYDIFQSRLMEYDAVLQGISSNFEYLTRYTLGQCFLTGYNFRHARRFHTLNSEGTEAI